LLARLRHHKGIDPTALPLSHQCKPSFSLR
jgi:hypothetical protein